MPSSVPNYPPTYGSMMQYYSQTPPLSSTPTSDENVPKATEFPEFSTQIALGGMNGVSEPTPDENADDSTQARRRNPTWTTDQNLVLLSGWIKYGTDSIVGRNQKSEAYWSKISEYCNKHCSFDPPHDGASCRNHFNYVNKNLSKWSDAYDNARRMQQSGWSENDVMAKAHELYSSGKNEHFNLMSEWLVVRDQPRYGSQVGGNTGSTSSGSKRSRDSDSSDSNSVGSNSVGSCARPMGREAAKRKGKRKIKGAALETVSGECNVFKQLKEQELERLEKIVMTQEEANRLMKEKTQTKKMKMFSKLSEKELLDAKNKQLLEKLSNNLFGN